MSAVRGQVRVGKTFNPHTRTACSSASTGRQAKSRVHGIRWTKSRHHPAVIGKTGTTRNGTRRARRTLPFHDDRQAAPAQVLTGTA